MKRLFLLGLLFSVLKMAAQPVTFEKELNYMDVGKTIIETDLGFILSGSNPNGNFFLSNTDKYGNLQNMSEYGGSFYEGMSRLIPLQDSVSYLLGGTSFSYSPLGDMKYQYIVKAALFGTMIWDTIIADIAQGENYDILQDKAGDIYVYGQYAADLVHDLHLVLYKFDTNGNGIWKKEYGQVAVQDGVATPGRMVELYDGNLLLTGHIRDSVPGGLMGRFYYMAKINPNGDTLWTRVWDLPSTNNVEGGHLLHDIKATPYHTFMMVGVGIISQLDSVGNVIWEHFRINDARPISRVCPVSDGFVTIEWGRWLRKYDYDGVLQYEKNFPDWSTGKDVIQTQDGGYAIIGTFGQFTRTDCMFNVLNPITCTTSILQNTAIQAITLSPNPTQDNLTITFPETGTYQIQITDIQGKASYIQSFFGEKAQLSVDFLPAGLYLITLESKETGKIMGKFVKE